MYMKEVAGPVKKIYLKLLIALYTFSYFKVELSRDEKNVYSLVGVNVLGYNFKLGEGKCLLMSRD